MPRGGVADMRATARALCAVLLAGAVPAPAQSVADEIRSILEARAHPSSEVTPSRAAWSDLRKIYEPTEGAPLWVAGGRPSVPAQMMLEALLAAGNQGLRPADYGAARLAAEIPRLASGSATAKETALVDTAMTLSVLRLASDLHYGRIDPRAAGFGPLGKRSALDRPAFVTALAQAQDPAARLRLLDPPFPIYPRLRSALVRIRDLARRGLVPVPTLMAVLRPGESSPQVPALRRLLETLGDLSRGHTGAPDPNLYDRSLEEAVRGFQHRHGLDIDGIVGPATLRQMHVPLAERARQIELAMERLRWLPGPDAERFVVVNIPEFRLFAFYTGRPRPHLIMDVVVGRSARLTRTPAMRADMTAVVFRPYWDVPPSIAKREILPRMERDSGYLERHHMEIVGRRVRQRPGVGNSLGLVKFVLPNRHHIYLHDTPARALFGRARRDFSHGCIRLADPAALAEFVLANRTGWDHQRITEAMTRGRNNVTVPVEPEVPVFLFYTTAIVDLDDRIHFFEDIYGHDDTLRRILDEALEKRGRPPY